MNKTDTLDTCISDIQGYTGPKVDEQAANGIADERQSNGRRDKETEQT